MVHVAEVVMTPLGRRMVVLGGGAVKLKKGFSEHDTPFGLANPRASMTVDL